MSENTSAAPILSIESLCVCYGIIGAVEDVSFHVNRGEIVTLIGANGAGKTTTLRAISGLVRPTSGSIKYKGEETTDLEAHEIVAKGVLQAPEGRGIFLNLSVDENLDLGTWALKNRSRITANLEKVFSLFPRLKDRRKQNAGTLSGGEQQMLAIGRALMGEPELLLLDEPSLGLAPQLIELIFEIVVAINKEGTTVLLVEQNAYQALAIAQRGVVLETGRVALQGTSEMLRQSEGVKKAYLGD